MPLRDYTIYTGYNDNSTNSFVFNEIDLSLPVQNGSFDTEYGYFDRTEVQFFTIPLSDWDSFHEDITEVFYNQGLFLIVDSEYNHEFAFETPYDDNYNLLYFQVDSTYIVVSMGENDIPNYKHTPFTIRGNDYFFTTYRVLGNATATIVNGVAETDDIEFIETLDIGTYNIIATFPQNNTYLGNTGTGTLTVTDGVAFLDFIYTIDGVEYDSNSNSRPEITYSPIEESILQFGCQAVTTDGSTPNCVVDWYAYVPNELPETLIAVTDTGDDISLNMPTDLFEFDELRLYAVLEYTPDYPNFEDTREHPESNYIVVRAVNTW